MNFIKRHLSLIYPLVMLLVSYESAILVQRAVQEHEKKLSQDYSIIISSKKPLGQEYLKSKIKNFKEITIITPKPILESLENSLSHEQLAFLKSELPLFYSLHLEIFPTQNQLESIRETLRGIDGIAGVEVFAREHSKVYDLLVLLKKTIVFFGTLLGILSILLMVKQVEVWHLQHSKRMEIMSYLGAPAWMKNKILFKLAVIDSLISSVLVIGGIFYILHSKEFKGVLASLEIDDVVFPAFTDFVSLLVISVCISILSALAVIIRQKDY